MADIRATTSLDNRQFSQGLQDALRQARSFKTNVQRTLSFDPFKPVQRSLDDVQAKLGRTRDLKLNVDTQQATQALRNTGQAAQQADQGLQTLDEQLKQNARFALTLRREYENNVISLKEFRQQATELRDSLVSQSQGLDRTSKAYDKAQLGAQRLSTALATTRGETSKLGISANIATGQTNQLANSFQQLQGAVTGALAALGLGRAIRSLANFSSEASSARNQYQVFTSTLAASGRSIDAAEAAIGRLADRLKLTETDLAQSATQLFRFGASIEEVEEIAEIGAASALAAGRTTQQGIEAVTQAIVTGNSQRLEAIGIISNLGTVYQRYASRLDTTADQLTNQQRIEAALLSLREETGQEVSSLDALLAGYAGTQSEATRAFTNFRRALGEGAEVILGPALSGITALVNAFNTLPSVLQKALTVTTLVTGALGASALAYGALKAAIVSTGVAQSALTGVLRNELVLRSNLGRALVGVANRYKILTRAQVVNTLETRRAAGALTNFQAVLTGLRGAFRGAISGLRGLTRAGLAFIATPLGATLGAIGAAIALVTTALRKNQAVLEPVFNAMRDAIQSVRDTMKPLTEAFSGLFDESSVLVAFWDITLVDIARGVALAMLGVGEAVERTGHAFAFFRNIFTKGVRQAFAEGREAAERITEKYDDLRDSVNNAARDAISGINDAEEATEGWRARIEAVQDEFSGRRLLAELTRLRAEFEGNEDAVEAITEEIEDLEEQIVKARTEAANMRQEFEDQLTGIEISLIEDDQEREIAEVRRQFDQLREDIRDAARENEEFAPFAGQFLSRAYQAEQERLNQIQEEAQQERVDKERQHAEEMVDAVRERERAIQDAQLDARGTDLERLEIETERRLQDTIALYDDLIREAQEFGDDTTRLEELRAREVEAIQERHASEVLSMRRELAEELKDIQEDLTRAALEGNERALLSFDLGVDLEELDRKFEERRAKAEELGLDLEQIEDLHNRRRLDRQRQFWDDMLALTEERGDDLAELEADLRLRAVRLEGDPREIARAEHQARLRTIEERYEDEEEAAEGNAAELRRIQALKAEAIRLSEVELQNDLTEIDEDEAEKRQEAAEEEAEARRKAEEEKAKAAEEAAERRAEAQQDLAESLAEAEDDLAQRRAELAGDPLQIARVDFEQDIAAINEEYDRLVEVEGNMAEQIDEIQQQRNALLETRAEEYRETVSNLRDEIQADEARTFIDGLLEDLDEADAATVSALEAQLRQYRRAYGSNGEVVDLVDGALDRVTSRIDDMVQDSQRATSQIFEEEFRSDLSDVEDLLADAAERARDLRARQEAYLAAIPGATPDQAERLQEEVDKIDDAIRSLTDRSTEAARNITTEAIQEYQDGLEEARREASDTAVAAVERDVRTVIDQVAGVQTLALEEARTNLVRQIARLTVAGVDAAALGPLREQVDELDAVLAQQDRALADFADDAFEHMRDVANAVLSEADARDVSIQTYQELIRLRRAALQEAEREEAGLEAVQNATRNLTSAQLDYVSGLQDEISRLQDVQGAYDGLFAATRDLAGLLDEAVPPEVAEAQRQLALRSFETVRALQEEGAAFGEYKDDLQEATRGWQDFQEAQEAAFERRFETLAAQGVRARSDQALRAFADDIAETFAISVGRARSLLVEQFRRAAEGEETDPFAGLDFRQPDVLRDILEGLNEEAARSPETIERIDDEIQTLEDRVQTLRDEIAQAVNFDAAGQQLVTGYENVLSQITATTGVAFDDAAREAVTAFNERLAEERERLQGDLEDQIGTAATAAGETAGLGLMDAFAEGIRTNENVLMRAIDSLLQSIRDRLPSSDAKIGPLSDLTHTGRMLPRTIMSGAMQERGRLAKGMNRLLSGLNPNASFHAAAAAANAPAGAGGPAIGTLNVDGRPQPAAPGNLANAARQMTRAAVRELDMQGLKGRR